MKAATRRKDCGGERGRREEKESFKITKEKRNKGKKRDSLFTHNESEGIIPLLERGLLNSMKYAAHNKTFSPFFG